MKRLTKLEREVVLACLVFVEAGAKAAVLWESDDDKGNDKIHAALTSAIDKFKEGK